jgi:hypothetical protein
MHRILHFLFLYVSYLLTAPPSEQEVCLIYAPPSERSMFYLLAKYVLSYLLAKYVVSA